ncbi:MAG: branched-chain amino acid ABC transporter permease [Nitriliruptor sp.]
MSARARASALSVTFLVGLLLALAAPAFAETAAPVLLAQEDDADADEDADADADAAEGEAAADPSVLFGTFRNADGPVEGVQLSIADSSGQAVGEATSGPNGQWEFEVPEPGDYAVTVEALPEGVELRDPEASTVEVTVGEGRRAVPIPLGEGAAVSGKVALFFQQILSGIRFGLIIAMTAVGLSLIFGTTGLINFAHGEIVIIGAVATWFANAAGLHLVFAAVLGVIAAALSGGILDRGVFRPLTRRGVGLFQLLVVTIGLSLVMRFIILIVFGGRAQPYSQYAVQQRISLGPFQTTPRDLVVIAIATVVLIAVATAIQRSRFGKAMRAVADNRDLAESSGIDVERVVSVVWIAGGALAGLGGILYATLFRVTYDFGFQPMLLLMFAGIILGGLGTAYGAMVGSLVVGLVTELSVVYFPNELKTAWALGVLVIVLLVRPQGLLGRRERIG